MRARVTNPTLLDVLLEAGTAMHERAKSTRHAIEIDLKVHREAGKLLEKRDPGFTGGLDEEHARAATLNDFEALEILDQTKKNIEDEEGIEIRRGLDLAADRLRCASRKVYGCVREGVERLPRQQFDFMGVLSRCSYRSEDQGMKPRD